MDRLIHYSYKGNQGNMDLFCMFVQIFPNETISYITALY